TTLQNRMSTARAASRFVPNWLTPPPAAGSKAPTAFPSGMTSTSSISGRPMQPAVHEYGHNLGYQGLIMKKTLFAAVLAALFAGQALAAPQTYTLDPTHSFPRFSYDHMGMSKQILRFNKATGTVVLDKAAKQANVDVVIDMTSIDTGFDLFDDHIQAA